VTNQFNEVLDQYSVAIHINKTLCNWIASFVAQNDPTGDISCGGSSGGGCEGDSLASSSSARGRPRRPNRIFSAGLPFLALLVTRFVLRRR